MEPTAGDVMSKVDELSMNPAEFGNLANRTALWKSQKLVGGRKIRITGHLILEFPNIVCSNEPHVRLRTYFSESFEAVPS